MLGLAQGLILSSQGAKTNILQYNEEILTFNYF